MCKKGLVKKKDIFHPAIRLASFFTTSIFVTKATKRRNKQNTQMKKENHEKLGKVVQIVREMILENCHFSEKIGKKWEKKKKEKNQEICNFEFWRQKQECQLPY